MYLEAIDWKFVESRNENTHIFVMSGFVVVLLIEDDEYREASIVGTRLGERVVLIAAWEGWILLAGRRLRSRTCTRVITRRRSSRWIHPGIVSVNLGEGVRRACLRTTCRLRALHRLLHLWLCHLISLHSQLRNIRSSGPFNIRPKLNINHRIEWIWGIEKWGNACLSNCCPLSLSISIANLEVFNILC